MALVRVLPVSARTRSRLHSIALGTALFLLAAGLILAMHALDPRRLAADATDRPTEGGTEERVIPGQGDGGTRLDLVPAVHG